MNCTAKKNNCDWPLCLIVGIYEEYKSIILAQALLLYETEKLFTWFLESLITIEGVKFYPSVIFTDESLAEIGAIKFVLPDVKSFRCDWHFQKDIHKKIATFHLQDNERNKIISFFYDAWYSKTETLFESCWGVFINYIDNLLNEAIGDKNKYENIK